MNIFKILASGDGNINEANVSAFLGYLLDPYADHGLGDVLLSRILQEFSSLESDVSFPEGLLNNDEVVDLTPGSSFEVEILLEQAFKGESNSKKEIVDIVVLIFQKEKMQIESMAKQMLSGNQTRELKQIILIENKIKTGSAKDEQLKNQYNNTIETINSHDKLNLSIEQIKKLVSYIYISPDSSVTKNIFQTFHKEEKDCPKLPLFWKEDSSESKSQSNTILQILKDIVRDSQLGDIEPVHQETVYLLRSFINFIESGFRTRLEEKVSGKKIPNVYKDFDFFCDKEKYLLTEESFDLTKEFLNFVQKNFNNIQIKHSPSHPVSISFGNQPDDKKFFSISRSGKRVFAQALLTRFPQTESSLIQLNEFLQENQIPYQFKNNKFDLWHSKNEPISIEKLVNFFEYYWKFLKLNQ
ncbi:PD-(D/E)XK nuclease family protein [Leptospira jelokensis]|uniref:Uncharacterized protein n=1 Tax=Leptospira jelokensis TaxID=2484931 RepID=A0A4Z0ZY59_9LEPT|nr:PD-(D/E)XK nuclease family protein [Leptospira jelokensis]TGL76898.1 hypothetical protein EHQ62_00400 [Leptospira jelokensis]